MAKINPYLHFNGNAEEAFEFYKSVFGGTFSHLVRFKDIEIPGSISTEKEANKIMHIALTIGVNDELMGSDTPEAMGTHNLKETRSKISITAESKDEAEKIYHGLTVEGEIEMPLEESPWGSYFAMFRDKFGIEWIIDFDPRVGN